MTPRHRRRACGAARRRCSKSAACVPCAAAAATYVPRAPTAAADAAAAAAAAAAARSRSEAACSWWRAAAGWCARAGLARRCRRRSGARRWCRRGRGATWSRPGPGATDRSPPACSPPLDAAPCRPSGRGLNQLQPPYRQTARARRRAAEGLPSRALAPRVQDSCACSGARVRSRVGEPIMVRAPADRTPLTWRRPFQRMEVPAQAPCCERLSASVCQEWREVQAALSAIAAAREVRPGVAACGEREKKRPFAGPTTMESGQTGRYASNSTRRAGALI